MHGTFYPSGTLYQDVNNSRSATRKVMVLENTRATFVLARNYVSTNVMVNQEDTTR